MNAKADTSTEGGKLDTVKWLVFWLLLGAGIVGFYIFPEAALFMRIGGLLVMMGLAIFVALHTGKGQYAWGFLQDTQTEVRKVVWPSRQETLQTTGIVIVMVIVMAILIWLIDSFLFWLVQTLTT